MKPLLTRGIILSRTDFGEADRIITLLTPDHGKLRLMAKGVRKIKSKLAGGIELFSVSDITFIQGRREIGTLISSRLIKHYGHIVNDIERVQLGYELIKMLHKVTEDQPETEYFELLEQTFAALDDDSIDLDLIQTWFQAQLLKQAGHRPNLKTDSQDQKLTENQTYNFDFDAMAFVPHEQGKFTPNHIKFLRLLFSSNPPKALQQIEGNEKLLKTIVPLIKTMTQQHIPV